MIAALIEILCGTTAIAVSLYKEVSLIVPIFGIVVLFLGLYKLVDTLIEKGRKDEHDA